MKKNDIRKMEMAVRHMERVQACLDYVEESLYRQPIEWINPQCTNSTRMEAKGLREDADHLLFILSTKERVFKEIFNNQNK